MRTDCQGFTLLELIVVLAVVSILFATGVPLAGAVVDAQRRTEARFALETIARALDDYWFDQAAFPATLAAPDFAGVYFHTGVNGSLLLDPWGGLPLVYSRDPATNTARVHSRGENGLDNGFAAEEFAIAVNAASAGLRKTRQRMAVIVRALAQHVGGGGTLTGTWSTDRAAMGLGSEYGNDGFGTPFTLDAATRVLRSAGPDRSAGNGDDLTS